jgi:hypothetical protein
MKTVAQWKPSWFVLCKTFYYGDQIKRMRGRIPWQDFVMRVMHTKFRWVNLKERDCSANLEIEAQDVSQSVISRSLPVVSSRGLHKKHKITEHSALFQERKVRVNH